MQKADYNDLSSLLGAVGLKDSEILTRSVPLGLKDGPKSAIGQLISWSFRTFHCNQNYWVSSWDFNIRFMRHRT